MTFPRSSFAFGGRAQEIADYDFGGSLRVVGRDLFYAPIETSGGSAAGFDGAYYANVTPMEISDRLENVEKIFQWYAIRHLRVYYAPATGSTSTVQIALGFLSNYNVVFDVTAPSQTQVLEMEPAALFPAWQPACIDLMHRGTKLFSCEAVKEGVSNYIDYIQGALVCTLLNAAESATVYGQLWVEYTVDFYQPTPILGSIARVSVTLPGGTMVVRKDREYKLERRGGYYRVIPEDCEEDEDGASLESAARAIAASLAPGGPVKDAPELVPEDSSPTRSESKVERVETAVGLGTVAGAPPTVHAVLRASRTAAAAESPSLVIPSAKLGGERTSKARFTGPTKFE